MTRHRRIRPFNTRDTYPEQNIDNDLCQAVVATGTTIFYAGKYHKIWKPESHFLSVTRFYNTPNHAKY